MCSCLFPKGIISEKTVSTGAIPHTMGICSANDKDTTMTDFITDPGERVNPEQATTPMSRLLLLRQVFAYSHIASLFSPSDIVIELGSGIGYGAAIIAQRALRVTGMDIDNETVLFAAKKHGAPNCVFELYDGNSLPYADGSFSGALSVQVIEHVDDDRAFVAEAYRVLRPGGMFAVTTPNATYRIRRGARPWNAHHRREYYPDELESVLKTAFTDVKVGGITGVPLINELEFARVREGGIPAFSGTRLSASIPEPIKIVLRRLISKPRITSVQTESCDSFTLDDFSITQDMTKAIDLIAWCRKS